MVHLVDRRAGQRQGGGPGQPDGRRGVEVGPVGQEPVVLGSAPARGRPNGPGGRRPPRRPRRRAHDEPPPPGPPGDWRSAAWCTGRRSSGLAAVAVVMVGGVGSPADPGEGIGGRHPGMAAHRPTDVGPVLVAARRPARPAGRSRTGGTPGRAGPDPGLLERRGAAPVAAEPGRGHDVDGLHGPGEHGTVRVLAGRRPGEAALAPDQHGDVELAPGRRPGRWRSQELTGSCRPRWW